MHQKYKEQLKDDPDMKRIYKLLAPGRCGHLDSLHLETNMGLVVARSFRQDFVV
jgi:hypothetical protein